MATVWVKHQHKTNEFAFSELFVVFTVQSNITNIFRRLISAPRARCPNYAQRKAHENFYQLNVSTQPNPQHLLLIPDQSTLDPSLLRYLISDQLFGSRTSNCQVPDQFIFIFRSKSFTSICQKRAYTIKALKSIRSTTHRIMFINVFAQRGS